MVPRLIQNSTMRGAVHEDEMDPVPKEQIADKNLRPYKGVTFYKRTGRWEANLWYQNKQHYLGASYTALEAARAYDKAILYTRSSTQQLNFMPQDYIDDLVYMDRVNFVDYKRYLRQNSRVPNCHIVSESCKGVLIDQAGRWEVKYNWKKDEKEKSKMYVFVGWYGTEEEALRAYNETAFKYKGPEGLINSFHQKRSKSLRNTRSRPRHLRRNETNRELAPSGNGHEELVHESANENTSQPRRHLISNEINTEIAPRETGCDELVQESDNDSLRPEIPPIHVPITPEDLRDFSETQTTVTCEKIHGDTGTFYPAMATHEKEFSEEPPIFHPVARRLVLDTGFPHLHGNYGQPPWNSILHQQPTYVQNSETRSVEDYWSFEHNILQVQTRSPSIYICTSGEDLSHLRRVPPFNVNLSLSLE